MILITGTAGFIGYHLTKKFLDLGENIIGIDNINDYYSQDLKISRLNSLGLSINLNERRIYSNENLIFIYGDLNDEETWLHLKPYNIKYVIHLAAQAGVRYSLVNPTAYLESNIFGFQKVIDFCSNNKIRNFIYASSSSVYGKNSVIPFSEIDYCNEPESLYAATKKSNELVAYSYYKTKNQISVGLRFFTVYGSWGRPDMAPMLFADAAHNKKEIHVYNFGNQSRDFTHVFDITNGIINLVKNFDKINSAEIFNIGMGDPIQLMDFIEIIETNIGKKIKLIKSPAQPGDVDITYSNTLKLANFTGFKPVINLKDGIKEFIDWYKKYYSI
jgi:UDP-glucuronate 4-epimerase